MAIRNTVVVIACDGGAAAERIARVLWNDPGTGWMRHGVREPLNI